MMLESELKEKMLTEIIFNKSRLIFEGTFYEIGGKHATSDNIYGHLRFKSQKCVAVLVV